MKKMIRRSAAVLAAVCGWTLCALTAAEANVGQAAGVLPGDSDVVFAVNLKSLDDQTSLLSVLPRAELEKSMQEELAKNGGVSAPSENSAEAAMRLLAAAMQSGAGSDALAVSAHLGADLQETPTTFFSSLVGIFTADPAKALTPVGAAAGPDGKLFAFPSKGLPIFGSAAGTNTFVLSEDQTWVSGAAADVAAGKNLTAQGSAFNKASGALASGLPDALLYVSMTKIRPQLNQTPEVAMMAAPLLKADGILLVLLPGATPSLKLGIAFPADADATLAVSWLQNLVAMGKGQVAQQAAAAAQMGNPQMEAEVKKMVDQMNAITVESKGSVTIATIPLIALPPRDEMRAQMMQAIEQAAGSAGVSVPMGDGSDAAPAEEAPASGARNQGIEFAPSEPANP